MKCRNCQYVECPECKTELETRCPKCQPTHSERLKQVQEAHGFKPKPDKSLPNIAMTDTFFGIFDYQLESQRVDGDALILTYVKHEPAKVERIDTDVEVK